MPYVSNLFPDNSYSCLYLDQKNRDEMGNIKVFMHVTINSALLKQGFEKRTPILIRKNHGLKETCVAGRCLCAKHVGAWLIFHIACTAWAAKDLLQKPQF